MNQPTPKFAMPWALPSLLLSMASLLAIYQWLASEATSSRAMTESRARPHENPSSQGLCVLGAERIAKIELIADRVARNDGRERIEYHAEVNVHRGKNVGVAWTSRIVGTS